MLINNERIIYIISSTKLQKLVSTNISEKTTMSSL